MTADEPSAPTISVGGNFTLGDIVGQSAIGSNISQQITYTGCTFIYPDGSTKKGFSWIYIQGARPAIDPKRIFGREKDLENIENILKDKNALVITGLRGTGKSTLASLFVDKIEESGKFAGIYWRKVDETTDINEIIGSFFTVIGKPVKDLERYKIADQINLLFQELNEASYLLVLDNFEVLLDPQTNKPLESKIGFSDLIEKENENCIKSKILFTSWDSLASERGIRPFSYQIKGLDIPAGILLLRREGMNESEAELKKAVELSGGHPLALILLAQLVRDGVDTLSALLNDNSLWEGEVAENILNKVYNERLSEDERKLLQLVSIFKQPVPAKAVGSIATEWYESKVKRVALGLTRKSLLQKDGENYWEESLIRTYSVAKLIDRPTRHKLATEYYLSLVVEKPAKKEDVQFLIEACHHSCLAEEYYYASEIIFTFGLYESLERWGYYRIIVELYTELLPTDHFKGKPLVVKEIHCHILGNMGRAYHALGYVEKALDYFLKAHEISQEIEDTRGECVWLGNVGNAYRDLGNIRKAIQYHEDALKISKITEDKWNQAAWLEELGTDYKLIGDYEGAIFYYRKSLPLLIEVGDKQGEGACLGNLGVIYRDLGELEKAVEFTDKSLELAKKTDNRIGEAECLGNLGAIYGLLGDKRKAIQYLTLALEISREIGNRKGEGTYLGGLGTAYACMGDEEKAFWYYDQALKIAKEAKDKRLEASCLGNLGNVCCIFGKLGDSRNYYEKALAFSREIEDRVNEILWLEKLGAICLGLKDIKGSISFYENALTISRHIKDRNKEFSQLLNIGNIYKNSGLIEKAIIYYEKALLISEEINDMDMISTCENMIIASRNHY